MSYGNQQVTEVSGYRLLEKIGVGGMGEVYKACNNKLNRFAAVKILHEASFADRFKNEAYIQSSVNHPNIARLYEYTKLGDKLCIIMEYVEGECLDQLMLRKGRLCNEEATEILRQIVSSLAYLHKKNIVQRDIKPQNFKIDTEGTVKMLDFGIAKHKYSPKLTQHGFVVGTVEYLAPEQLDQMPELKSDVWALSVLAYEMLTGYMPFEASNVVMMQTKIRLAQFTNPKILLPQISEKLLLFIESGLRVNTAKRISAKGMEELLENSNDTAAGNLLPFKIPAMPAISRKRAVTGFSIVAVLFIFLFLRNDGEDEPGVKQGEDVVVPATQLSGPGTTNDVGNSENKIIINTPGISDAELILPDGGSRQIPYIVRGREGEKFDFIIRAKGYTDKEVQVVLTPRRMSYEFNLEKK